MLLVAGHELGELDLEILSGGLGVVQDAVQGDIQVGFCVLHDHAGVALPVGRSEDRAHGLRLTATLRSLGVDVIDERVRQVVVLGLLTAGECRHLAATSQSVLACEGEASSHSFHLCDVASDKRHDYLLFCSGFDLLEQTCRDSAFCTRRLA